MEFINIDKISDMQKINEIAYQKQLQISNGQSAECVIFAEFNHTYTKGRAAKTWPFEGLPFPVIEVMHGGTYGYHGPGQRCAHVLLNLRERKINTVQLVEKIEDWIISSLKELGVECVKREGFVGVWVQVGDTYKKIAPISMGKKSGVSSFGFAINVNPNLENFNKIVHCNLPDYGLTSLEELGVNCTMKELDSILKTNVSKFF